MSKSFLPGQNSKYWGYDLNNYLLSLRQDIDNLQQDSGASTTLLQTSGVGFTGSSFSINDESRIISSTGKNSDLSIGGEISYHRYIDNSYQIITKILPDKFKPFDRDIYVTEYNTAGKVSYPYQLTALDINYIFYAVYLFFDEYTQENTSSIKTVISKDYIFRGDMVMIGILEKTTDSNYTFIPRIYSSGKTLYETSRDTWQSTASIKNFTYNNTGSGLPFEDGPSFEFYFATNGINPEGSLKPESGLLLANDLDVKWGQTATSLIKVRIGESGAIQSGWSSDSAVGGKNYLYYLAPSGNIYVQEETLPTNFPIGKYTLELTHPLSSNPHCACGALVYLGSLCYYDFNTKVWCSAKQNGISPIIVDTDAENPYKVLLEQQRFWFNNNGTDFGFQLDMNQQDNTISFDFQKIESDSLTSQNLYFSKDSIPRIKFYSNESNTGIKLYNKINNTLLKAHLYSGSEGGALRLYSDDKYNEPRISDEDYNFYEVDCYDNNMRIYASVNTEENGNYIDNAVHSWHFVRKDGYFITDAIGIRQPGDTGSGEDGYHCTASISSYNNLPKMIMRSSNSEVFSEWAQTDVGTQFNIWYNDTVQSYQLDCNTAGASLMLKKLTIDTSDAGTQDVTVTPYATFTPNSITFTAPLTLSQINYSKNLTVTTEVTSINITKDKVTFPQSITCKDITFTSDRRLKTNITPLNTDACYRAVQDLNVHQYTYTKNNYNTLGLIAQDIEELLPEYATLLVHENEQGEKIVSEHKLLFILWEALKKEIQERKKLGGE